MVLGKKVIFVEYAAFILRTRHSSGMIYSVVIQVAADISQARLKYCLHACDDSSNVEGNSI